MDFVMEINATYTRVARFDKNSEKMSVVLEIPSFIGWNEKDENWVIGDKAKNLSLISPQNVFSVMDLILHINFAYIKEKSFNKYLEKFLENIKERVERVTRECGMIVSGSNIYMYSKLKQKYELILKEIRL